MSDLLLISPSLLLFKEKSYPCASGKGGVRKDKVEGDGATPCGSFPLREVYYRPDRLTPPKTLLPLFPIEPIWGWCDDPYDSLYNQKVTLPYPGRHEVLWRDDHVYDIIVVVGYNDAPIIPGKGSAIFLHLARPNYEPTEGCLAFTLPHMLDILANVRPTSLLVV